MEQTDHAELLTEALRLIKAHIGANDTKHNRDLHAAVGKIVDACRATDITLVTPFEDERDCELEYV